MTKAELIERVYAGKNLPRDLTKKTVAQIVDAVFVEMGDYFIRTRMSRSQGPRLTYPGFGTFSKRRRPPRMVKNPKTGAPITIPQQETITFSPGQGLRALLNRSDGSPRKVAGSSGVGAAGQSPAPSVRTVRPAAPTPAKSASGSR